MATITSAQSGDFSSTTTWTGGVVPVSGDRFDISSGHTVTITADAGTTGNGFVDSYIYGILRNNNNDITLKMNGRLYIKGGGTLHLTDGAEFVFKGGGTGLRGIFQENEDNASVIMEGSDGMTSTTTTSALNEGAYYLPLTSATNFAVGEWISIFDNTTARTESMNGTTNGFRDLLDEGFIIHEISSNNVYIRHLIGPEDVTVSKVRGSYTLFLSNAKKFRKNQHIIVGTGSNRTTGQITEINYVQNRITIDTAINGNPVGSTIYLSGTDKIKTIASKVRKVATVTTATSSSGGSTITVANVHKFAVGDEIFIEERTEAGGTTDYAESRGQYGHHVISSISGTTITLSSTLPYNVVSGAKVARVSRNIVMRADTAGTDECFFYSEYYSSNYRKKLILKDVFFKDWGDNGSNVYSGVTIRGYHSTNNDAYLAVTLTEQIPESTYGGWLEGIVTRNSFRRDYSGIWAYDSPNFVLRNSLVLDSDDGITLYYEPRQAVYNCITAGSTNYSSRFFGMTETWEIAYNLFSRADDQVLLQAQYDNGFGFHDNWIDGNYHGVQLQYCNGMVCYKNRISGTRYGWLSYINSPQCSAFYNEFIPLSGLVNTTDQTGTSQAGEYWSTRRHRGSSSGTAIKSYQHNFEYDSVVQFSFNMEIWWDYDENAWRIYRRYDNDDNPMMMEQLFVPADTVVRATMKVKLAPSFSGSYPYLATSNLSGGQYNGTNNQLNHNTAYSNRYSQDSAQSVQYTASAASAFEEKQLTVTARGYDRYLGIGLLTTNRNAAEGFWVKDFHVYLDTPYDIPHYAMINNSMFSGLTNVSVRKTFTQQKKRLGGRIK
jgi:hypothetical protein